MNMNINMNDVRSLVTLASLLVFLGLMAWVWWPGRRAALDSAALLPFDERAPAATRGVAATHEASDE